MKRNIPKKKTLLNLIFVYLIKKEVRNKQKILNDLVNYIPKLNKITKLNLQIKIFYEMMNNITNWKKYNVSQYEILFWIKELTII